MRPATRHRTGLKVLGVLCGLALTAPVLAQVNLKVPGVGLGRDRIPLLNTYPLPQGNTRYGVEYRPGLRQLLGRPNVPVLCSGGIEGSATSVNQPSLVIDPNGVRLTTALNPVTIGGQPYQPFRFGSIILAPVDSMAYEVDARDFVATVPFDPAIRCSRVTRVVSAPLPPEQAVCGGGLTDDPKDGWSDNSVFRDTFDEAGTPADLVLIPWRETSQPTSQFRYGYLVRNVGGSTARNVALRETFAGDSQRFQRALNPDNTWSCTGYGGGFCDRWPNMELDQGYMTSNVGTIPPNGCLKFEVFRGFTFTPAGDTSPPSGVIAARVLGSGESEQTLQDNEAVFGF